MRRFANGKAMNTLLAKSSYYEWYMSKFEPPTNRERNRYTSRTTPSQPDNQK